MLHKDTFKEKIVFHLKNFSNENKPLNSEYFYKELIEALDGITDINDRQDRKRSFQRLLASAIQEIITDQLTYKQFVVCSCNEGYYIPKTEAGFIKGRGYLISKIDEVQQRIRFIDEMRKKHVYGDISVPDDMFSAGLV